MHSLEQALKNVIPGELHVVIAEREDHVTGVTWTRRPQEHLSNLARATYVGRVEIQPSIRAISIVHAMSRHFQQSSECRATDSFWTISDFEDVVRHLDSFDLDRGTPREISGIKPNDRVQVTNLGRGVVTGFTLCGRVKVKLDRPDGLAEVCVLSPRSCVKPVVTAVNS